MATKKEDATQSKADRRLLLYLGLIGLGIVFTAAYLAPPQARQRTVIDPSMAGRRLQVPVGNVIRVAGTAPGGFTITASKPGALRQSSATEFAVLDAATITVGFPNGSVVIDAAFIEWPINP